MAGHHDPAQRDLPAPPPSETDSISQPSSRRIYHRQASWHSLSPEITTYQSIPAERDLADVPSFDNRSAQGLGLRNIPEETNRINRVPVGSRSSLNIEPVDEGGMFSQTTTANNTPADRLTKHPNPSWPSPRSSTSSLKSAEAQNPPMDRALLHHNCGEHHCTGCPTHGDVLKSSMTWFTVTILILALYSATFSAIFLGISLKQPRYGNMIGAQGRLSPEGATLLSALFSKTVELSFATVFVATLGQMLSRQAFVNDALTRARGGGISIAQMNMRLWIMQPGTLITNWIGVRYALPTLLGGVTLLATISAIFYTTAAEALVSPKSKMGPDEPRQLFGQVRASYANSVYMQTYCQTPITRVMDQEYYGTTCLQMVHAGQAYHNFESWFQRWWQKVENAQVHRNDIRPPPMATLYDNTTVTGQWITPSNENITADSKRWGRLVQNITMAMPHANLFNAARDPVNKIVQVEDLKGAGQYVVKAAVPAPAVNVLCAGLSSQELQPMIVNNDTQEVPTRNFTTVLDDVFGWKPEGTAAEHAPWFSKAPIDYNTIGNWTRGWGSQGIYLLAKPQTTPDLSTPDYVVCSIRSMQYPHCTSSYQAAEAGGNLTVHCDSDPENTLPYSNIVRDPPVGVVEKDWKDVAEEWVKSIALNNGISDANASLARVLTQMTPTRDSQGSWKLRGDLPSLAEGVAVLAASTLLLSSNNAPFQHKWTFSDEAPKYLLAPQYDRFHAIVRYADYASGPMQRYQYIFYIILLLTFGLNVWCMSYLVFNFWNTGHVTDYTEPQNLFALAINSPPSNMLAGACGAGPSGDMLGKKWYVDMAHQQPTSSPVGVTTMVTSLPSHPHFYVRSTEDNTNVSLTTPQSYISPIAGVSSWPNPMKSPHNISRFSPMKSPKMRRRTRTRTMDNFMIDESPAVEQYMRLVGKR